MKKKVVKTDVTDKGTMVYYDDGSKEFWEGSSLNIGKSGASEYFKSNKPLKDEMVESQPSPEDMEYIMQQLKKKRAK